MGRVDASRGSSKGVHRVRERSETRSPMGWGRAARALLDALIHLLAWPADRARKSRQRFTPQRANLHEGWVIANHILVSFHVAFISSVLALPAEVATRWEVLWFIFWSPETLVSAIYVYVTFHAAVALHEIGHFLTAARLHALNQDVLARVQPKLALEGWPRLVYLLRVFALAPFGRADGIKREGLNFYPDAPYNLAVAAAGPRASRNVARICLPPALLLLILGLTLSFVPAIYVGRLLLGIGIVTLLDFLMADPGKYREFTQREKQAKESSETVAKVSGWLDKAPVLKRKMVEERMQDAVHPLLGRVTAPWQFRNCGMGGRHTEKEYPESNISMQEAMFVILGARNSEESQEMTVRLQTRLKEIIEKEDGCRVMGIGLEGGLAPYIDRGEYPLPEIRLWSMMRVAIEECGYQPGTDVAIALDPAMSELEIAYREEFNMPDSVGMYLFWRDQTKLVMDRDQLLEVFETALTEYQIPIISIEDGFSEDDHKGWQNLLDKLGDKVFVIGDDLVTTNDRTIEVAAGKGLINSVLVKANQIGTLYETLLAVLTTLGKDLEVVVSHRSKSPNDDMEAHIALACNSLGLKAGGGSNTERLVKYHSITMQMHAVENAAARDHTGELSRAVVERLSAYEEPTNAGIPTVGAEVDLRLPDAGVSMSFKGATPLGTSAGTGEAVHLIDKFIEHSEYREIIEQHGDCIEEVEPGVFRFRSSISPAQVSDKQDENLSSIFRRAKRYQGKGCQNAVDNVHQVIAPYFLDRNVAASNLLEIDRALLRLELETARRRGKLKDPDSTDEAIAVMQRKQNLGMNAILSTSLALARGIAHVQGKRLHELLREEMLSIVDRLARAHGIAIGGGGFEDYLKALRAVAAKLEANGESLHVALRRTCGLYEVSEEAPSAPAEPPSQLDERAKIGADQELVPAARPTAPGPRQVEEPIRAAVEEAGFAPREVASEALSLLGQSEQQEIAALSLALARAIAEADNVKLRADALIQFQYARNSVSPLTRRFEIANDRVFITPDGVAVPYAIGCTVLIHEVKDGRIDGVHARALPNGVILTDSVVLDGTGIVGKPIRVEWKEFTPRNEVAIQIHRVRDMASILARLNESGNKREVVFNLRFVVARLCSLSFQGFLGAKNLQPEIHNLSTQLSRFLNGPFAPQLKLMLRILVRNISGLVLRPKVIDELWNDTIELSEVHLRGSAITNEIRRSAHHALGRGTLRLARAYLDYLSGGDGADLPYPGQQALCEADEDARSEALPLEILTRVVANLEELLGTSQVVTRIREWQLAYTDNLLRCESGNRMDDDLEQLVKGGIRDKNRWVYQRYLRILRKKSEEGAWRSGIGRVLDKHLEDLQSLNPEEESFDAAGAETSARTCIVEFIDRLEEEYQEDLFRSLEGVLATYGQDSFAESFFRISKLRDSLATWTERQAFEGQKHLLHQLDCLLEEMGYLSNRRLASTYEEEGLHLRRCLQIIHRCVANLPHDGIPSRELWDLSVMLLDENKTHAQMLNVLESLRQTYHKLFRRVSCAYEQMQEALGLNDDELRAALANYQRYLHDLNSMVHFADMAKSHIEQNVFDLSQRIDGEPPAPTAPEGAYDFLHFSDTDRLDEVVDDAESRSSLQDVYGGKGCGLLYISHLRLPTRDGFVIPTRLPRAGLHHTDRIRLRRELRSHVRILEEDIARDEGVPCRFGDPEQPLLLAVRAGSVFTMPGMLATVVFVGLTDEVAATLAMHDPWFAYDSYRRYLASYAEAVWGLNLEDYNVVDKVKEHHGVQYKRDLPPAAMKEVAEATKAIIRDEGHGEDLDRIISDPFEGLFGAVDAAYASWNNKRALQYREVMGLSEDWHTAVIVQQMACGNRSNAKMEEDLTEETASLTGVIPRSVMTEHGFRTITGDVKFSACGDDLVGGVTRAESALPLAQLDAIMPVFARDLKRIDAQLRRYRGTDPEIEFTVERGRLSILQARMAQTATDESVRKFEDPGGELARGSGIRGGAFRGVIAFDEEDMEVQAARIAAGIDEVDGVLLVLENPTPNEIPMILHADGLVAAKGGSTSHAAVAIHAIENRPYSAVFSVSGLRVDTKARQLILSGITSEVRRRFTSGDVLSIHGETGAIYEGSRELLPLSPPVPVATS